MTEVRLSVTPSPAVVDAPPSIVLCGCRAGQSVTVRARMRDGMNRLWESHAVFRAGPRGEIDAAVCRPLAGTYASADDAKFRRRSGRRREDLNVRASGY